MIRLFIRQHAYFEFIFKIDYLFPAARLFIYKKIKKKNNLYKRQKSKKKKKRIFLCVFVFIGFHLFLRL